MNANTHIYCPRCEAIHPIGGGEMPGHDASGRFTNPTDLCCLACGFIVATTYVPIPEGQTPVPPLDRFNARLDKIFDGEPSGVPRA